LGELPLGPYDSCRLMSMNLMGYVTDPFTKDADFDYIKFNDDVMIAQRMMDNVIDLEIQRIDNILSSLKYERDEYEYKNHSIATEINLWETIGAIANDGRRTGLGFTGLADVFASLGLRYASNEAILVGKRISEALMIGSYRSSIIMAKERGPFPAYRKAEFNNPSKVKTIDLVKRLFYDEPDIINTWERFGRRNLQNLAIAPTGTISIMTQTSSGIEPVFNLRYTRRRKVHSGSKLNENIVKDDNGDFWEEFIVVHKGFNDWYK